VDKDLSEVFKQYKDKPVYLLEAGCPSSGFLGSSEARQAEFVRQLFNFWDANRRRLKVVNFIWLHDISDTEVQSYTKYYNVGQRGFAEYLGTLGLRHHDGRDKEAFTRVAPMILRRGLCDLVRLVRKTVGVASATGGIQNTRSSAAPSVVP